MFNLGGNYFTFNYSASDEEADAKALRSDWQMVGADITQALEEEGVPVK